MSKDEALKLALEHFETWSHEDSIFAGEFDKEITAIKEALAQPEQEPYLVQITTRYPSKATLSGYIDYIDLYEPDDLPKDCEIIETVNLYTTPPQRKPLTDEQRDAIARQAAENDWHDYKVIDAVEAAHGIKELKEYKK